MDTVSALVRGMRSDGAELGRTLLSPPWSFGVADSGSLGLVAMARGRGWIVRRGAAPLPLAEGDLALVGGPEPFTVTGDPTGVTAPWYVVHGPGDCRTPSGEPFDDTGCRLGPATCGESADAPVSVLTGYHRDASGAVARMVGPLSGVAIVPGHELPAPLLALVESGIAGEHPARQAVVAGLLELLLLFGLRSRIPAASGSVGAADWSRALADPVVGAALRALQGRPADRWTVASLAGAVGVSRAGLARRFTALVGEPPMAHLARHRLDLAADLLRTTDLPVAAVARRVGYAGASSLSAALMRRFGTRPGGFRESGNGGTPLG